MGSCCPWCCGQKQLLQVADPAAQLVFHRGERIFLGENRQYRVSSCSLPPRGRQVGDRGPIPLLWECPFYLGWEGCWNGQRMAGKENCLAP